MRAVGPPPPMGTQTMLDSGLKPSVWGMKAISSSGELIVRTWFIDNHLLARLGTYVGEKQPAAARIGQHAGHRSGDGSARA